ncbi:MAG: hypothetical protein B7733_08295 [Myxococcales bacterium FL481]|nr:MAG: hypothetical protein B7733_08295 [Myxococcales bacterium FL481]
MGLVPASALFLCAGRSTLACRRMAQEVTRLALGRRARAGRPPGASLRRRWRGRDPSRGPDARDGPRHDPGGATGSAASAARIAGLAEIDASPDPASRDPSGTAPPSRWQPVLSALAAVESLAMFVAAISVAAVLAGAYETSLADDRVFPGVRLYGVDAGRVSRARLDTVVEQAASARLDRSIELSAAGASARVTARALGAQARPEAARAAVLAIGRSGDVRRDLDDRLAAWRGDVNVDLGFTFDEDAALDVLFELAPQVERPALPTRIVAAERVVRPAEPGVTLLPYDSLSHVAIGLAAQADHIELAVQQRPVEVDPLAAAAHQLDIGSRLGSFSTPYSMAKEQAPRSSNLKVGAAALDNLVLLPGETFSFNEVVGERSAEAGYQYAPGIEAGEVIDVLGGGICQISSTLYGAAFFAGLELLTARPHSRPSAYVDMGLDSTVVYPTVDLRLRNPYDFPVVFHVSATQGSVRAEVLGPRRDFEVAFERELTEVLAYRTVYRDDARLRTGTQVVAQRGRRGFRVQRVRKRYRDGELVATESWPVRYRPTTEIVRRGTNPAGAVPQPKKAPPLRDPTPTLRIVQ